MKAQSGTPLAAQRRRGGSIRLRKPGLADATGVSLLLGELGYPSSPRFVAKQIAILAGLDRSVMFVAADGKIVLGFLALRWDPMIHRLHPVARIATLVISRAARRRGIGRLLVERALATARRAGCEGLEVTTGLQRREAHRFYEALGFHRRARRYYRSIRDTATSR